MMIGSRDAPFPRPAVGLIDHVVFPVVDANRAERAFGEVEDLMPVGRPFAGKHIGLVVAVEMLLVGLVASCNALQQLVLDVRLAGDGGQRRKQVEAGEDAVLDRPA